MSDLVQKLPSVLVMAVLVAIFIAAYRQHRCPRVRFWLWAWILVFLQFTLSLLPADHSFLGRSLIALKLICLYLAGVAFLVAVSKIMHAGRQRWLLAGSLAVPGVVYSILLTARVSVLPVYAACIAAMFLGAAAWVIYLHRRFSPYVVSSTSLLGIVGSWTLYVVLRGEFGVGFYSMLLVLYTGTAVLFPKRYPRWTPGVLATCVGFFTWAGVWLISVLAPEVMAHYRTQHELWNVPKFVVAFGMILTLLEDETLAARAAEERERNLNLQMQRFADLTSQLLSGVDVTSLCSRIAQVITQATNFQRVVILLSNEQRKLYIAGHSGVPAEVVQQLGAAVATLSDSVIGEICAQGRQVGGNSFICSHEQMLAYGAVKSRREYDPNPYWRTGDELLVPLRSPRGSFVGCISLDDPTDVRRVTPEEMSKMEMLGGDLAVAVEKEALQRQLVLSEKLAGVGRLVSGVAHELNNPLTAVLGYSELLREQTGDAGVRREAEVIHREGQRMKRIIGNLLRFAQQSQSARGPVEIKALLDDVLNLRSYEMHHRGIDLVTAVSSELPHITADENQMKQVLLNLLSNAIEAVEQSEQKRITIEGRTHEGRVLLSFCDTGAGFSDLDRVFDPFFTTKAIGKGTGMGLSICYGILKQHGGDIYASNLQPSGACVTLELPVAGASA